MAMMFERVVVVGTGLLGGSIAKDLRKRGLAKEIVGICRSSKTAELAIHNGVVDQVSEFEHCLPTADLLILATPMQTMLPILQAAQPYLSAHTTITDVGSVKTDLYAQVKATLPSVLSQFVFAHPIAGGEQSGITAAKHDLFVNKHLIVTSTDEVKASHLRVVKDMWQALGASVIEMGLLDHDAVFAKTSHLPHVIAFSLVNFLSHQADRERLFDLAAAGFYDFTRIASSDAEMWRDICVTNKEQVIKSLSGFRNQIDHITELVENADEAAILNYFSAAKLARDTGLLKKAKSALAES